MYKNDSLLNKLIFFPLIGLTVLCMLFFNEFIKVDDVIDNFTTISVVVHFICSALLILSTGALVLKYVRSKKNKKRHFATLLSVSEVKEKCVVESWDVPEEFGGSGSICFDSATNDEIFLKRSTFATTFLGPVKARLTFQNETNETTIVMCELKGQVGNVFNYILFVFLIVNVFNTILKFIVLFFDQVPVATDEYFNALWMCVVLIALSFLFTTGTNASWKSFASFFSTELQAIVINEANKDITSELIEKKGNDTLEITEENELLSEEFSSMSKKVSFKKSKFWLSLGGGFSFSMSIVFFLSDETSWQSFVAGIIGITITFVCLYFDKSKLKKHNENQTFLRMLVPYIWWAFLSLMLYYSS